MQLKDMFVKPIDRDIQGVIIVGQGEETNVAQELEEYVVTKELQKHFADFLKFNRENYSITSLIQQKMNSFLSLTVKGHKKRSQQGTRQYVLSDLLTS